MVKERQTRDQKRESIRAALIDAAEELFAEHGFWGVSLDQIADRANLTKGAVYSNFESKEDLLLAVSAKQAVHIELEDLPDPSMPLRQQVREIGRLLARAALADDVRKVAPRELELASLALQNERFREVLVTAARRQSLTFGTLLKERAAAQGVEISLSAEELGRLLTAMRVGLTRMRLLAPDDVPEDYYEDAFEILVLGASDLS